MKHMTIDVSDENASQMKVLAAWWGLPVQRHNTAVMERAIQMVYVIEAARRSLSDSDFVGFLAEVYRPTGSRRNENEQ